MNNREVFLGYLEAREQYYCADCGIRFDPDHMERCKNCHCTKYYVKYRKEDVISAFEIAQNPHNAQPNTTEQDKEG